MKFPLFILGVFTSIVIYYACYNREEGIEKRAGDFEDAYGPVQREWTVESALFRDQHIDSHEVEGPFQVKLYQGDGFTVTAYFHERTGRLAVARYLFDYAWTPERLTDTMHFFAKHWVAVTPAPKIKPYLKTGSHIRVLNIGSGAEVQSPGVVSAVEP